MENEEHKMDGDGYLRRLQDLTFAMLELVKDMANEEQKKQQLFKIVQTENVIQFPGVKTNTTATAKQETAKQEEERVTEQEEENEETPALDFNEKDIMKMPKIFRNEFKTGKVKARIRRTKNKYYEIRVQLDKIRITASSTDLETAKKKFIEKLNEYESKRTAKKRKDVLFGEYLLKWLETVKKPYIKESTYKEYQKSVNLYLLPKFGQLKLTDITTFDIQEYLNKYTAAGKFRTAKSIYQLLNPIFAFAVADNMLNRSPMEKVRIVAYEQEHGTALTRAEEKQIVDDFLALPTSRYRQAFVFIMYTGLRRSELASAQIDGEWITVITAKQRKGHKEKARRIPVSPMLKKLLPKIDLNLIRQANPNKLTCAFKDLYTNHHLHDLRHTFVTRCQECGIAREIVSLWVGHTADKTITTTVYTHLEQNVELQLKEIARFIYDFE